jgi:hypothetical protein
MACKCKVVTDFQLLLTTISDPHILVSEDDNRGIYILVGRPRNDEYMQNVIEPIAQQMREMRNSMVLPPCNMVHRRGEFSALSFGVSMGPGATVSQYKFSEL